MKLLHRRFDPLLLTLTLALGAACVAPLEAASRKLAVDSAKSRVTFAVHANVTTFTGTVETWTLDLTVPEGSDVPEVATFSADVTALKTGKDARDRDMLRWIDNTTHPKLEFALRKISPAAEGGANYVAEGDLSLHGVTKPVTIPITLQRAGDTLTITGATVVDTRWFTLPVIRKFAVLTVAPEVNVSFNVTGTLQ